MKSFVKYLAIAFCTLVSSVVSHGSQQASVDWSKFLQRHDLVWEKAPMVWHDGPFMGNGMLGSMLHQVDDNTLRISLGRADVEDHKKGDPFVSQSRLPNGYFTLKTQGKITGFTGRLDLYNAETSVKISTDQGAIELRGIVHSDQMLIAYKFQSSGEENPKLKFIPLKAIAPARFQAESEVENLGDKVHPVRVKWANAPYVYNPDPVIGKTGEYNSSRQILEAGGETGTAWEIRSDDTGYKELRISIEHSYPEQTATQDAVDHLTKNKGLSFEELVKTHRKWWHQYYPKSFFSLSDTEMEGFYWVQVYKFGSGARKGRAYMDTMGPWIVENTAWANGWFNLNTQLSYWFLSTANRLEVAESLFTKLDECLPTLVANMPAKYGDDCAGMSTIVPQTFVSPFPGGRLGFTGELLWTCHDYWLMLERTMDAKRTTENFFPLLKKSVNTFRHFMIEGEDGKIHLPPTSSPEYGRGEDCNFNLALFKWGCETLITIAERHKIDDPLLPKWKDIVARIVAYPTNENGYMVAKDFPFEQSHRHYSHLMMIYPLCEINIDQEENKDLMKTSIDHWINYPGTGNAGYSWSGAAAMYALMGDAEEASKYLNIFMKMQELFPDNPAKIHGTTMYTETGRIQPVTETPLSLCDSMQLMVLQSWGDTIRVFPAIPKSWQDVSFDGFLAKGGFTLSAAKKGGKTQFVSVTSNAGEPCKLLLDFVPDRIEGISESAVTTLPNGRMELNLKRGETATFYAEGVKNARVVPSEPNGAKLNAFGLKK